MLSIKHLYNKLFSIKAKKTHHPLNDKDISFAEDTVIMTFGLTPNYEIDLSLEMKDLTINNKADLQFKAQKLATFFHSIVSGGVNSTILDFLANEMSDSQNKELFESIIYYWLLLDKQHIDKKNIQQKHTPLIAPSKVFSQYVVK
jgi:hypothetical protein